MQRTALSLSLVSAILFLLSNCNSSKVLYDYDTLARFANYKTFSFIDPQLGSIRDSQLIAGAIQQAITEELVKKGLLPVDSIGDLEVAVIAGAKDRINVAEFGYAYWPGRWGWGGYYGGAEIYLYPEGTLVIDMIDSAKEQLVWRGSAAKTLSGSGSPEKVTLGLKEAVSLILASFPPAGK